MSAPNRALGAVKILVAGGVLGIIADLLLREMPWGVNLTFFTLALLAGGALAAGRRWKEYSREARGLAIGTLVLGLAFAGRDSRPLTFLVFLGLCFTLALTAASLQGVRLYAWGVVDHVRHGIETGIWTMFGSLLLVVSDIPWGSLPGESRLRRFRGVLIGLLIAAPLVLVFGALFAGADPVFAELATRVLNFNLFSLTSHAAFIGFVAALAAGGLRFALLQPARAPLEQNLVPRLSGMPAAIALGTLDILFLLFVVVQARYFFGGSSLVASTTGLTYAEYARRGFFELLVVAGLVIPVLLGADTLVRGEPDVVRRRVRGLAGVLLVLLAVIMVSALQRMRLYVAAFGLSEVRLYATATMVYIAVVAAWLGITVLRGRREGFATGAVAAAYGVLALLYAVNPDATIVRVNLARPGAVALSTGERPFDARYAASLSADAFPTLLAALPQLDPTTRCLIVDRLRARWQHLDQRDWRTLNWARLTERRLAREYHQSLSDPSCPLKELP
jgi:hypothetical protein